MNFYAKVAIAVGVLIAGALALIFLLSGSDEEAIEKLLEAGATAAEKNDVEGVIALLSKDYRNGEQDYDAAVKHVRSRMSQPLGQVTIAGSAIQVDGGRATANVRIRVSAGPYRIGDFGLMLQLKKENGAWKVTSAEEIK